LISITKIHDKTKVFKIRIKEDGLRELIAKILVGKMRDKV
jgi:hypothetical protein